MKLILRGIEERLPPRNSSDVLMQLRAFYGVSRDSLKHPRLAKQEVVVLRSHRHPSMKERTFLIPPPC
ncbi:hypothetical protein ACN38_g8031 [Penicillium nordicum]|uniref:Uncharacterized protein n=1 Tax=Penicillium nordicum TaxID=229535 RepID=A0A0M9WDU2_9EURO|nr:hypothetical protein ACN38_g8031 [Penicillium nordicum]